MLPDEKGRSKSLFSHERERILAALGRIAGTRASDAGRARLLAPKLEGGADAVSLRMARGLGGAIQIPLNVTGGSP